MYWLTLDGHALLGRPDFDKTRVKCTDSAPTAGKSSACQLVPHHDIVLNGLAEIMLATDQPPTAFVIVGDHKPHFLRKESRPVR